MGEAHRNKEQHYQKPCMGGMGSAIDFTKVCHLFL